MLEFTNSSFSLTLQREQNYGKSNWFLGGSFSLNVCHFGLNHQGLLIWGCVTAIQGIFRFVYKNNGGLVATRLAVWESAPSCRTNNRRRQRKRKPDSPMPSHTVMRQRVKIFIWILLWPKNGCFRNRFWRGRVHSQRNSPANVEFIWNPTWVSSIHLSREKQTPINKNVIEGLERHRW